MCDFFDGSISKGIRELVPRLSGLNQTHGFDIFSEPEKLLNETLKKIVRNNNTFILEDQHKTENDCNGKTMTSTISLVIIYV